jgi:hypothetical protein
MKSFEESGEENVERPRRRCGSVLKGGECADGEEGDSARILRPRRRSSSSTPLLTALSMNSVAPNATRFGIS